MIITSHIAVTELVARAFGLSGTDYLLAHFFGWGIDIDHLVTQFRHFVQEVKEAYQRWKRRKWLEKWLPYRLVIFLDRFNKKRSAITEPRSFIQEPMGVVLIFMLSAIINNFVPVVFLFIHFLMDAVMKFNKYPLAPLTKRLRFKGPVPDNTVLEYFFSSLLLIVCIVWRLLSGFNT